MSGMGKIMRQVQESADFLLARMERKPLAGMITGTGLGDISKMMVVEFSLPYREIPNFPLSTVEGHEGNLLVGTVEGRTIMVMEGRFHLYEGYSPVEITFPIRVMARIGVRHLFISSAAGGLNPLLESGDLLLITDHINLTGTNPLIGPNLDAFGPRFPDMSKVYDPQFSALARKAALETGIMLKEGVYVGIVGPSLETPAETRFLRMIGGDAVGMSTVLEVIAGVHCGMRILGIVVITNVNLPDCMEGTSIEEVIAAARKASPSLGRLWKRIIGGMPE